MPEVLVVHDEGRLRRQSEKLVRGSGYTCDGAASESSARAHLQKEKYNLVLLDINMPSQSGMELLTHIRTTSPESEILILASQYDARLAEAAVELGLCEYLVKPVRPNELLIHISTALYRRDLEAENRRSRQRLEVTVRDRTDELLDALMDVDQTDATVTALETGIMLRLARVVEVRDEDSGHHLERMSQFCAILGRELGLPADHCVRLQTASQLHDVGTVVVPDAILFKAAKLSPEEFEVVKGHAEAGYQMLIKSQSELVQTGAIIARTHHERWDGGGYPRGLSGEDIPIEGRIAAIADVFDSLTSHRVYRAAFSVVSAIEMIESEREHQFDPQVIDAFHAVVGELQLVQQRNAD
jgi:putative two-component system response regulator